jgi:hypothetical protein
MGELHVWEDYASVGKNVGQESPSPKFIRFDCPWLVRGFLMSAKSLEPTVTATENTAGGTLSAAIQNESLVATKMNLTMISIAKRVAVPSLEVDP